MINKKYFSRYIKTIITLYDFVFYLMYTTNKTFFWSANILKNIFLLKSIFI